MEVAEPIVGSRRVRQFRTAAEKRHIVEETRKAGVSVATVAQAHGVNANQVFYWRKLYEAGQLEITPAPPTRDRGTGVRLLPVSVDDSADWPAPILGARTAEHGVGSDVSPGSIELTLARGQVRIAGMVDAATLRTVLRCLLA
jgi:transposase